MTRITSFAKVKVIVKAEIAVAVLGHLLVLLPCKGKTILSFCQTNARLFLQNFHLAGFCFGKISLCAYFYLPLPSEFGLYIVNCYFQVNEVNLYIRFFDEEALVHSVAEALDFLSSLDYFVMNDEIVADLEKFVSSNALYPKHIRVSGRSFFIAIKTTANTLEEFKSKGAEQLKLDKAAQKAAQKEMVAQCSQPNPGWYAAKIVFKRVVLHPDTQKFHYVDTPFICKVKAESPQDCYDKVVSHLRNRQDVDPRSQFPSIKGGNFEFEYLG